MLREQALSVARQFLLNGPIGLVGLCDIVITYADGFEGEQVAVLPTIHAEYGAIAWVGTNHIAVCSQKQLQVWNPSTNTAVCTFTVPVGYLNNPVSIRGKLIVSSDNCVHMWDIETERYELTMTFNERVGTMIALDNERVVIGCNGGEAMLLWNVITGQHERTFDSRYDTIITLAAIGTDSFASGSVQAKIRIWDAARQSFAQELRGHVCSVVSLACLAGNKLASASFDRTARIWDLESGACSMIIAAHGAPLTSVTCMDTCTIVTCAPGDPFVRAWSLDTGAEVWTIKHDNPTRVRAVGCNKLAVSNLACGCMARVFVWH